MTAHDVLKRASNGELGSVRFVHGLPVVRVGPDDLPGVVTALTGDVELRARLSLLWAVDQRPAADKDEVLYLFSIGSPPQWLAFAVDIVPGRRQFRSITPRVHAAKWYEREIRDMFGLIPVGHPDLRRLVRHEHWPTGTHPLKKTFSRDTVLARRSAEHRFRQIEGEGVFQVPVGPIHAGIIEPGHFRFTVAGEPIMQLEVHHFWKHRGIEKLFESRQLMDGLSLAERVSGDTTVGHALAYCEAAERLLGIQVPRRARYLRTLQLELERLHNHIGDVGAICNDTSYAVAHAHTGRMKERLMQLCDRLTGSRFMRATLRVGGMARDPGAELLAHAAWTVRAVEQDFTELERIVFANASLTDRLETTGVLEPQVAHDHAAVGVVGRASGCDVDVRRDRPFAAYDELSVRVAGYRYGDVRARMRVRIDEIHEAARLIQEAVSRMPDGPILGVPTRTPDPGEWAVGAVEGWRGEILYVVMAGPDGGIHRCKVRDPSFVNWPAIQWAAVGNIIPDFPLINKSFNLSYAGNDL